MIIRKPYAFIIKNFRKIHIFLLVVGMFLLFKTLGVVSFVNNFLKIGTYDFYADPISKHITFFMNISLYIMIIGSVVLLFLLMHKEKPWKTYLVPVITYVVLFLILIMIKGFFNAYTEKVDVTNLRLSRDLLMIAMIGQIPSLAIFGMRIFGLDIKKFDFNSDLESLDLSEEDREEIEVSLNIDINTFKRLWRKLLRNLGYFYKEHTKICKAVAAVLIVMFVYNTYNFIFVVNKTYRMGQTYNANGYSFVINDAYFTDKDVKGEVISNDSNFVIVNVTVTNNDAPRQLDTSNFHLHAGNLNYNTTEITYAKEFSDLGNCYKKVKELKRDEKLDFIIVYKVDKKIRKGRFDLYYQEQHGIFKLRKIHLKIKDVSQVSKAKKLKLGEYFDVPIAGKEDSISIETYQLIKVADVYYNECHGDNCILYDEDFDVSEDERIMELTFSSDSYEAKNMIDFLNKYGRINYKDSKGKEHSQDVVSAISRSYLGKTVYLKVPKEFEYYEDIRLEMTIRSNRYYYQLT